MTITAVCISWRVDSRARTRLATEVLPTVVSTVEEAEVLVGRPECRALTCELHSMDSIVVTKSQFAAVTRELTIEFAELAAVLVVPPFKTGEYAVKLLLLRVVDVVDVLLVIVLQFPTTAAR